MNPQSAVPQELRRHLFVGATVAGLAGVVGLACLAFAVLGAGTGWAPGFSMSRLVAGMYGAWMMYVGYRGVVRNPAWYRRSNWVIENSQPTQERLTLKRLQGLPSLAWWVEVQRPQGKKESYAVLKPGWKTEGVIGQEMAARTWSDPTTRLPLVFETEHGRLWAVPTTTDQRRS